MVLDMHFADGTQLWVRQPEHLDPVSITPGVGAHRLLVRVEVEPIEVAPGCNLVQLDGELHAEQPTGPRWVASFHPVPVALRTRPPGLLADLVVPLTDAQVLALEQDRNGQDLQIRLDLRASLPQSREHAIVSGQDTRRVPASTWEAQIQQLGRAVSFTVTVPLPMDGGPLADAARHLRKADQQITKGEYSDAVREARLAIQVMRDMQVWPKHVANKRDEQTQADRYGVILDKLAEQADGYAELLQVLFNQASGPQHASGALRGATWVRADAVALTGLAAAMLHRLGEEVAR
jgi:hypothetical protein